MIPLFWNGNISPLQKLNLFRIGGGAGAFVTIMFFNVVRYLLIAIGSAMYGSVQTVGRGSLQTCLYKYFFWKNRRCRTQRSFNISSRTHMMCHDFTFLFSLLRRRQSALVLHYIESAPARSVVFLPSFRHGYHSHVCFFWPRIDFSEKPSQKKFVFVAVDSL